jgi:hypothetical protein
MGPTTKCEVKCRHVCNTFILRRSCPIALHKGTWAKDIQVHILLPSVLHRDNCSVSNTANLPAEIIPQYPLAKSLGGPQGRSVQFGEEIHMLHLLGIESRFLGRPSRSQSLYRQRQACQTRWYLRS